jgi:hypothetical protein
MGWKGVTIMDQRVRFIAEHLKGYFRFNEPRFGACATIADDGGK